MFRTLVICTTLLMPNTISFGQVKPPVVGSDKDAHGCIGSAGYTYSMLRNDCIRVFEEKIRLVEVKPRSSSASNAAVIFSKNKQQAEVFIPGLPSSVVLNRIGATGNHVWSKGNLELVQSKGYILKRDTKVIFRGE